MPSPSPRVAGLAFSYPARPRASGSPASACSRPPATIVITYEDGATAARRVPPCVARACERDRARLPLPASSVLERLDDLERRCCMEQLTRILSRREHGSAEASLKLASLGFSDAAARFALARAQALHLLDDQRSARALAEGLARRGWGAAVIRRRMRDRGFCDADIAGATEDLGSPEREMRRARRLLERRGVPGSHPFERLARYIAGKGYSSEIACHAVREHLERRAEPSSPPMAEERAHVEDDL